MKWRDVLVGVAAAASVMACLAIAGPQALPAPKPAPKSTGKKAAAKAAAPAAISSDQAVAARWLRALTLRQKVAQLIMIGFSGRPMNTRSRDYRKFVRLVAQEQ